MSFVRTFVEQCGVSVRVVEGRVYDVLRASDAAIVTSGTATLETGLMAIPMVIVYRISAITYYYRQQAGACRVEACRPREYRSG